MLFNLSLKSLEFMINSFIPGIITSSSYPKRSKHINKGVEEDKAYTIIKIKFIKSLNVSNLHQINLNYHEILSVKPIFHMILTPNMMKKLLNLQLNLIRFLLLSSFYFSFLLYDLAPT